jgi:hypothetical protein
VVSEAKATVLYATDSAGEARAVKVGDVVTIRRSGGKGRFKIVEVTAVVENKGPLATHTARGAALQNNREDAVWLIGDRSKVSYLQGGVWQRLGVMDGTMKIPGIPDGSGERQAMRGGVGLPAMPAIPAGSPLQIRPGQRGASPEPAAPPQTGPRREVKWLVAVEGDAPLKVVVSSQKGGTAVKAVEVK